jgi:enoyl-CoA hydratase
MENVSLTKNNGLAWLVIDRESKMNALNAGVLNDLETAFKQLENDPEVLVIAIRGAGEKAFVAGADISQFPSLTPEEAHAFALRGQSVFSRIESSRKPVIAAINGFALGGGCELALSCHLRIAAETARFGQPEVK